MTLRFQRDLPHSMLEIRTDTADVIVHPHAPRARRYARGLTADTIPAFDALSFMVHTAHRAWIVAFAEECAPFIASIQRALRLPSEEGADEINPAAEAMTAIAERMGI